MKPNPRVIAHWSPSNGFYFLTLDGNVVREDGTIVYLDRKSDCERYVKRHMGMNLTHWKSLGYNTAADYGRATMIPLNPRATDDKTVAERKWAAPKLAAKPQQPCDIGLFSDDANQLDMCEMFMDPSNPP